MKISAGSLHNLFESFSYLGNNLKKIYSEADCYDCRNVGTVFHSVLLNWQFSHVQPSHPMFYMNFQLLLTYFSWCELFSGYVCTCIILT